MNIQDRILGALSRITERRSHENEGGYISAYGSTPAEAVCRCIVQVNLGDKIDVPDELCGEQP